MCFMSTSIPLLVSFEAGPTGAIRGLGPVASIRECTPIAVVRMKTIVDLAAEFIATVKPRARADEYVAGEPFRAVIAGGSTAERCDVVVSVRAIRGET